MSRDADRYFDKWYGPDDSFEEEAATVVMSGGRAAALLDELANLDDDLDDLDDQPTTLMRPEDARIYSSLDPDEFALEDGMWEDPSDAQRTILRTPSQQQRTVIRKPFAGAPTEPPAERAGTVPSHPSRAVPIGLAVGLLTGIVLSAALIAGVFVAAL